MKATERAEANSSLTGKELCVSALADRIVALMESEALSLDDLLTGLKKEREATWRERRSSEED